MLLVWTDISERTEDTLKQTRSSLAWSKSTHGQTDFIVDMCVPGIIFMKSWVLDTNGDELLNKIKIKSIKSTGCFLPGKQDLCDHSQIWRDCPAHAPLGEQSPATQKNLFQSARINLQQNPPWLWQPTKTKRQVTETAGQEVKVWWGVGYKSFSRMIANNAADVTSVETLACEGEILALNTLT